MGLGLCGLITLTVLQMLRVHGVGWRIHLSLIPPQALLAFMQIDTCSEVSSHGHGAANVIACL